MLSNQDDTFAVRRRAEFDRQRTLAEQDAHLATSGRPPLEAHTGDSKAIDSLVRHEPNAISCGKCGEPLNDGLRGEGDRQNLIQCANAECGAMNELSPDELEALGVEADIGGIYAKRHGLTAAPMADAFMTCACGGAFRILDMRALASTCPGCHRPLSTANIKHTVVSARQLAEMTKRARLRAGGTPVL